MISVKNLHKSFGKNHVLKGIDFDLEKKECVAIIGPSGSGKSTFLRCINRLEIPTSGNVYFNNSLITEQNITKYRQKIAMVFQHFNLIKNMTVMENLTFAPIKLGILPENLAYKKARKYLKFIGLEDKENSYPASLSGGQSQRIAIIRAMMMNPEVLLFDEPTSALDPESIGDVLNLIRSLVKKEHLTSIIVTHEMNFAKEIATRIVFMDEGKIIEEGSPSSFFKNPKTERVKIFLEKVLK